MCLTHAKGYLRGNIYCNSSIIEATSDVNNPTQAGPGDRRLLTLLVL